MKTINYKGKGEHSVRELELIIEQQAEELHLIKSGQKPLIIDSVSNSALEDNKIPKCKAGTHKWDYHKRYMQKSCTVCDVHYLA